MWFLRSLAALASPELIKRTDLVSSKWFSRGWTLQELIAPNSVTFFDREWEEIGTRATVSTTIALATSIDEPLLNRPRCKPDENLRFLRQQLEAIAASARMRWAQGRETTRGEDLAYCLMGLFDVNMPLLYGEGEEKAFTRLQREIITVRSDQSILAWTNAKHDGRTDTCTSILAPTPRVRFLSAAKEPFPTLSSQGNLSLQGNKVQATVFLGKARFAGSHRAESFAAALQFQAAGAPGYLSGPALHLERLPAANGDTLYRKVDNSILWLKMDHSGNMTAIQYGRDSSESGTRDRPWVCFHLTIYLSYGGN